MNTTISSGTWLPDSCRRWLYIWPAGPPEFFPLSGMSGMGQTPGGLVVHCSAVCYSTAKMELAIHLLVEVDGWTGSLPQPSSIRWRMSASGSLRGPVSSHRGFRTLRREDLALLDVLLPSLKSRD
jgi:hypothetical protein